MSDRLTLANDAYSKGHISQAELAKISLDEGAINQDEYAKVTAPGWKKGLSKVGGFGLETAGLVGGEVLGGGLGGGAAAFLGPEAIPAGVIAGKTAGGAVGQGLGEVGRKELDTMLGFRKQPGFKEIRQTLKGGAGRGAFYSAGGQALGGLVGSEMMKPIMNPIKEGAGKLFEFATGQPKKVLSHFIETPFMKGAKPLEEAKAGYAAARKGIGSLTENIGLREGEVPGIYDETLTKSKMVINDISKALKRGEQITAEEAVPAYEWVNSRLRQLKPSEGVGQLTADAKNEYFALTNLRKSLQNEIQRESPEMWSKIVDYAKATTKDMGSKILPGGYGGRYLARRTLPLLAGFMSPGTGLAVGASMSPKAWTTAASALSSGGANSTMVKIADLMRRRRQQQNENSNSQP